MNGLGIEGHDNRMLASRNTNGTEHIVGTGYLGTVKQDTEVNLTGGEIYGSVYGGGNMAAYKPVSNTDLAKVIIDGCEYYPLFIFVGRIRSTIT